MIPDTREEFEKVMSAYRNLSPDFKQSIRHAAIFDMKENGFDEIGSSDVNHYIFQMYRHFGGFEGICLNFVQI